MHSCEIITYVGAKLLTMAPWILWLWHGLRIVRSSLVPEALVVYIRSFRFITYWPSLCASGKMSCVTNLKLQCFNMHHFYTINVQRHKPDVRLDGTSRMWKLTCVRAWVYNMLGDRQVIHGFVRVRNLWKLKLCSSHFKFYLHYTILCSLSYLFCSLVYMMITMMVPFMSLPCFRLVHLVSWDV